MTIQIDSREKARAIKKILAEFDRQKVDYYISKLYAGDYCSLDNPRVVIDRKQNLSELCGNVCQMHDRFRRELVRAKEHGIKVIILCEHGNGIQQLCDVVFWTNPRSVVHMKKDGKWVDVKTRAMQGTTLYKVLCTISAKYDVDFVFCDKKDTGAKIIELLGGDAKK